jgi:hypothetical protein
MPVTNRALCRAPGKCQWPRKQNVSGSFCGQRSRCVTITPSLADLRAGPFLIYEIVAGRVAGKHRPVPG